MTENQLIALVIATINTGLAARSISNVTVLQNYQPTQQGVPTNPTAYLYKIGPDKRYGYLKREDVWDPLTSTMVHKETQWMESTFQISCLAIQTPTATNPVAAMTATDLANSVASILQGDAGRGALQAQGVGILRVQDIRNVPFEDDRGRNEFIPNFDFTLTHESVIISSNPVVTEFDFDLERV